MINISMAAQDMLQRKIAPFWLGLMDEQYGGFY